MKTEDIIKEMKTVYGKMATLELDNNKLVMRHNRNRGTLYPFPNGNNYMLIGKSEMSKVYELVNS